MLELPCPDADQSKNFRLDKKFTLTTEFCSDLDQSNYFVGSFLSGEVT